MFYGKRDRKGGKKMVCYAGPDEFPVRKVKVRKVKVVCCYAGPTKFPVREVKSKKIILSLFFREVKVKLKWSEIKNEK